MAKKATSNSDIVWKIKSLADDSISRTRTWEQNQRTWHKMRMRIKKEKTFPFIGCSNIRMPTIEIKIRKLKAALTNVIFGIRPVVQVIPNPGGNWESARKIEKFLDHLIMNVIKLKSKVIIAIDQTLEKGMYLLKPYFKTVINTRIEEFKLDDLSVEEALWLFDVNRQPNEIAAIIQKRFDIDMNDLVRKHNIAELDKVVEQIVQGKTNIKGEFQDVICNYPDVALCEPERVYVPPDSGFNPQSCLWIIHEFFLTIDEIKLNERLKGWNTEGIDYIGMKLDEKSKTSKGSAHRDKDIDSDKDTREGIEIYDNTGKIKIWEYYGFYDINGDGEDEKCVVTCAPDFNQVLRKITLPFYSGKYPFIKLFYELIDDRWFSHRGIPEIIEDIVKEIDMQHNQKLDQQTLRNTPMFIYRAGMINKNTMQMAWGQGIPAHGMQPLNDLIAPLNNNNPNVEFSYEKEQMILESKVEELIGQIDFTLQSMINKREPRTLGEVNLQQQNMQQVFSLDADMFRSNFEELFNWIWELWCQYGDDSYEFAYFGKNGYENIKMTKEELQGHYKITVRGNDQNTNAQIRLQKAQMILMAMQNPLALQSGIITPMNIANAYKLLYQELDVHNWEEFVSPPQPQQPPPPNVRMAMDDLTDAEQAQVLVKQGIQPDVQGRSLKSKAKIQEKDIEQYKSRAESDKKLGELYTMLMPEKPEENNAEET